MSPWKAFGTWGVGASYQLGGIIGCLAGLGSIPLLLNPLGITFLVAIGIAIVVGALAGEIISTYDAGTGGFDQAITGAVVGMRKPAGIAITAASVTALAVTVATATPIMATEAKIENGKPSATVCQA